MHPRVGVVIPVYDTGAYLRDALESALAQSEPVDVVLVDDGSTDPETLTIIDEYADGRGVRLVRHAQNAGLPAALNTGFGAVEAPYVFLLGSDDVVDPDYARLAADVLDADDGVAIVTTPIQHFGGRSDVNWVRGAPDGVTDVLFDNTIPGISVCRQADWSAVGGFRALSWSEDWDFWVRVLSLGGRCVVLPRPAYSWRIHGSQITSTRSWEDKLAQQVAMVRANPDPWAQHLDLVMEKLWQTQMELNYYTRRYGRFNAAKKSAVDTVLRLRERAREGRARLSGRLP